MMNVYVKYNDEDCMMSMHCDTCDDEPLIHADNRMIVD